MRKIFRGLAALAAIVELGCAAWALGQGPVYGVAAPASSTQPSAFSTYAQANGVILNGAGPESGNPGMTGPQFLPPTTPSPFFDPIDRPVEGTPSGLYSPAGHGSDGLWGVCDECPNRGLVAFVGYDTWRSIVDGNWQNNGIHSGVNFGTRLGRFSDWTGIGFQIGASVGAYNWSGTDYRLSHQDQAQPQGFVTYGFFRKANETSSWSAAVVQDWMLNSNYGVMAQNPTLGQWRGQAGYALNAWHEFGVWGAVRLYSDSRQVPGFGRTDWRPINQLNAYWHYKWSEGGADTWLWVGVPENDRLNANGSLGDYTVGLLANVPLNDRAALYALVTYMHPSASAGPAGAEEDAWNFSIGVYLFPGRNARSSTVAGQCWMPQLPVANNGYFLVDTNHWF